MGFKTTGVRVEVVEFNGRRYRRYPDSPRKVHRRYFSRSGGLLHRDVWAFHNGPIPAGCDIHHKNEDTGDNRIENLECVSRREHLRKHEVATRAWAESVEAKEHLARIRPLAAEWHSSPEGLAWHRQHSENTQWFRQNSDWRERREPVHRTCTQCGESFQSRNTKQRYCSGKCVSAAHRAKIRAEVLRTPRTCIECGGTFYTVQTKQKYCTSKCKQRVATRNFRTRAGVQSDS